MDPVALAKVYTVLQGATSVGDSEVPCLKADYFLRDARLPLERWVRFERGISIRPKSRADAVAL